MRAQVAVVVVFTALLLGAADVYAMASGGGHGRGRQGGGSGAGGSTVVAAAKRPTNPLPEPSTLYAVTTSLAVLSGAGWYIRRRK